MIGNTFGSKTRKFGGAFPVWKDVFSKVEVYLKKRRTWEM